MVALVTDSGNTRLCVAAEHRVLYTKDTVKMGLILPFDFFHSSYSGINTVCSVHIALPV